MSEGTLTPAQKFEEQMKDRIRQSIGDLMPDDMLKATIDRVLNEAFFVFREVKSSNSWNAEVKKVAPPLYDHIQKLLTPLVEQYATQWFNDHQADVIKCIEETMGDQMLASVAASFQRLTSGAFVETSNVLADKIRELDRKAGGPGTLTVNQY